jgi:hypothetical protein
MKRRKTKMKNKQKVYIASSWRNPFFELVAKAITTAGHELLSFKEPGHSFSWDEIDPNWESWTPEEYIEALLRDNKAILGFRHDMMLIDGADWVVMLMPCGLSSGIELGYASGRGKKTMTLILPEAKVRPDLMIKVSRVIVDSTDKMVDILDGKTTYI